MRLLLAALLTAGAIGLAATPSSAADMPKYPDLEIPEVDYGLEGSFYLRGSGAWNLLWTREHVDTSGSTLLPPVAAGYGYSVGAGFGYETGTGLRFDGTVDYIHNVGLSDGTDTLSLRAGVALANIYYDFPMGDALSGGWGAYIGAGLGGARYAVDTSGPSNLPSGTGWTPAAAAMAGVQYDMGSLVADVGYRLLYLPQLSNNVEGGASYYLNDNTIHEVRGTLRYRLY